MILSRTITRSFDMYQEVEVNDELIKYLEESGEMLEGFDDFEHYSHRDEYETLWAILEEKHIEDGETIYEEKVYMPDQNYDDICDYGVYQKSNIVEKEYI